MSKNPLTKERWLESNAHGKELFVDEALTTIARLQERVEEAERWVHDLQAGMYINCVYCGHRYGPDDEVPATMADALKEHIEQCPKHPMSALKALAERRTKALEDARMLCKNDHAYDNKNSQVFEAVQVMNRALQGN